MLSQGKVDHLVPKHNLQAEDSKDHSSWVQRIKDVFTSPKFKDLGVVNMIFKAQPTVEQYGAIFDFFADKSAPPQYDELSQRMQKTNLIGTSLWGTYLPALRTDLIQYTKHYHEAPRTRLLELEKLPNNLTLQDVVRKAETEPDEENTADEEIMDLRLERLSRWYGMDLEDENDAVRFGVFMHEFDLSPGERTLDWCMDSAPPPHTFEELAIIKLPEGEKVEDNL